MENVKVTYRGWAGHLCVASKCLFHLNTLIECGDKAVIVSTVGEYRPDHTKGEMETVGIDRFYETMVFAAKPKDADGFIDIAVDQQLSYDGKWSYNDEWEANKGHLAAVEHFVSEATQ